MHKRIIRTFSVLVAALVLTLGASSSVYALADLRSSYGPSFGGAPPTNAAHGSTPITYQDGLTINGNTYNISKYVQKIPTATLYIGAPAKIKVKLWEDGGIYKIQGLAMFLNLYGANPSSSKSNTWVQYSKTNGLTVHDPNNMLGPVSAIVKHDKTFWYVTFQFTPSKQMNTSWMILTAWDNQLSTSTAKISNAVNFSYVPYQYG